MKPTHPDKRTTSEVVLDALATRIGVFVVMVVLAGACFGAAIYGQRTIAQLERDHAIFRDTQIRNGYVAMSDIQRLVLVAQEALSLGGMEGDLKTDFLAASDIIFVRIGNFSRMIRNGSNLESGADSIAALESVLAIADLAVSDNFSDLQGLSLELLWAAEQARGKLVQFLDDMRRKSDGVLDSQAHAVRQQQAIVLMTLAGLAILSGIALLLLRREVLGRHAREAAEKKVAFLAYFDQLTGLPNRSQFQGRLKRMLESETPLSLLLIDLDDFKLVNDTYGHAAGDSVLKFVAGHLKIFASIKDGFAARLGGDEFAIVVPKFVHEELEEFCQNIISISDKPIDFEGDSINFGTSVGVATSYQAQESGELSLDMLTRVTDFALYESKSKGRNQFTLYDSQLALKFTERRAMANELPWAVEQGKLEVYLQPKVDAHSSRAIGFEALVRWRRGDQIIPPDEFIQVAEETGLIQEIDRFVLDYTALEVASWNANHGTDFTVSVNLSVLHFTRRRIVSWVKKALAVSALPPHLLTLEITETVQLRDWDLVSSILHDLRNLGVRISIDDFGTGYSSLAYLRAIRADELKIDRSLVHKIGEEGKARLLLASVLDIARNMEMDVVVEGIETADQLSTLIDMGVDTVQGFFFGRPEPLKNVLSKHTGLIQDDLKIARSDT